MPRRRHDDARSSTSRPLARSVREWGADPASRVEPHGGLPSLEARAGAPDVAAWARRVMRVIAFGLAGTTRAHGALLAFMLLAWSLGLAPTAHAQIAQAGLAIGWEDCRTAPGAGFENRNFACGPSLNDLPLVPTLRLTDPIDSVLAIEMVVDVIVASPTLPTWWNMAPGGCHGSPSGWGVSLATAASCGDAWLGQGAANVMGWLEQFPGSSPNRGRLLVAVAALPGTTARFESGTPLALCRLALRSDNTLTCTGCSTPACLVFNSIVIRRFPGSQWEEATVSSEEVAGAARVKWQGGLGADCAAVPTRRSTWGSVKSLYR